MDSIKLYSEKLEKLKVNWDLSLKPKKEKGIYTDLQMATKEATDYFNEPKLFGRYLGFIKFIGIQEARKRLAEQKESGVHNPAFFFRKIK